MQLSEASKRIAQSLSAPTGQKTHINLLINALFNNDHTALAAFGQAAREAASKLMKAGAQHWLPKQFAPLLTGVTGAITKRVEAIEALVYYVTMASKLTQISPQLDPSGERLHGVILFAQCLTGVHKSALGGEAIADVFVHTVQKYGFGIVVLKGQADIRLDKAFRADSELQRLVNDHIHTSRVVAQVATQQAAPARGISSQTPQQHKLYQYYLKKTPLPAGVSLNFGGCRRFNVYGVCTVANCRFMPHSCGICGGAHGLVSQQSCLAQLP
jgi:hypothetical protein